jgi:hypothetical protein
MNGESYRLRQSPQRNRLSSPSLSPKPNLLDSRNRTIVTSPDLGSMARNRVSCRPGSGSSPATIPHLIGKSPRIATSLLVHFPSALAVHFPNALARGARIIGVWPTGAWEGSYETPNRSRIRVATLG